MSSDPSVSSRSSSTAELKRQIIRHAIETDVQYVARYVASTANVNQSVASLSSLFMAPFLALFIHESERKSTYAFPELPPSNIVADIRDAVRRSRNALKLFEDSERGVEGQVEYFRDSVIAPHRDTFVGGVRLWILRGLAVDLGIFGYAGQPIGNTHASAFFLGIDSPTLLTSGANQRTVQAVAEGYGRYFGRLGAQLTPDSSSFLDKMRVELLDSENDVRSASHYSAIHNGRTTPDLNALLLLFRGLMNLVAGVLPLDSATSSQQTIAKLQFLTTWEVVRSIRLLVHGTAFPLSARSEQVIHRIEANSLIQSHASDSAKPLRNSLMHYAVDSRISESAWVLREPMYGLPRAVLGASFDEFAVQARDAASYVADELNHW